jgi:nucleotide-binding universal stress UspA family protein
MEFKKILVPVDGSEYSMRAAKVAADMAGANGAEVVLTHCHKPFPAVLGEPYYQQAVSRTLKDADTLLDPFRKIFRDKGVSVIERIMEGPPRNALPDVAEHEKCDLIVIGSRGLSNFEGIFLGSVTHRVLRSAPCPVMVIR